MCFHSFPLFTVSKILSDAKSKALSNIKDATKTVKVYVDVRLRKRLYIVEENLAIFLSFTCLNFDFYNLNNRE